MLDFDRFSVLTFDCYGTLIDWERGILTAMRPVLERYGVAQSDDQILELFGEFESKAQRSPYRTYRDVLTLVMDGFSERLDFTPSDEERYVLADSVKQWPPFPDSAQALRDLSRHYTLAILSNVDDALFSESARLLETDFAAVITAEQVSSYKPDPRNFQQAIERLGLPREQILHVAQSLFHDIAPANDAGLTTVWINRRHGRSGFGATPPMTAQPDLEVPDLATFARLVEEARGTRG